jgi:hypothetical protein
MLEDSPWVAGNALMLLTLNKRARHLEDPPADEGEKCIFKQLHAALEKLLLAPAGHSEHVEIIFEWNEGHNRHVAGIPRPSQLP